MSQLVTQSMFHNVRQAPTPGSSQPGGQDKNIVVESISSLLLWEEFIILTVEIWERKILPGLWIYIDDILNSYSY